MGSSLQDCRTTTTSHTNMRKYKVFVLLLFSLIILALPPSTYPAPVPKPAPKPFTPGLKIGALAGAALVIKALLLSQALSGDKVEEEPQISSSYGAPSYNPPPVLQSYNPPSYEAPSVSYGAPSSSYGAPSSSYGAPSYEPPLPSYNG